MMPPSTFVNEKNVLQFIKCALILGEWWITLAFTVTFKQKKKKWLHFSVHVLFTIPVRPKNNPQLWN